MCVCAESVSVETIALVQFCACLFPETAINMFLKKNNLPFGTCTYVVNVGNVGCSQLETKLSQKPQDMRTQNTCL